MEDFEYFLRDGVVLCRLMNFIKSGSIQREIKAGTDAKSKKHNIRLFLNACETYGVPKEFLFDPEYFLFMTHISKVTRCIFHIGKLAEKDSNFKGPYLGEEPYEPTNKTRQRRSGMPIGDDIHVAHVNVQKVMKRLPSVDQ
ncbi:myophilin-like [Tachypleus tridentatus]|uniref:myophilin-like n=1 Tax=Tachypleus tridentatus TaxID=6853 RepID=UPI003FD4D0BB